MKKSLGLSLILVSFLGAYDAPSFKTDGYIRFGYQNHKIDGDKSYKQNSIGGKLSIYNDTFKANGIGGKISFYTTNKISKHENEGVPFFDENANSYSILGEAYLFGRYQNTTLKIGRQELDTPFADTDDIGMIPNTFEAAVLANTDLPDTTLLLAGVRRWSGVDTEKPSKFQKMQNDNAVKMVGIIYEGIKGLGLSAYYYDIDDKVAGDIDSITYGEAIYGGEFNSISYEIGLQGVNQNYKGQKTAKIVGYSLEVNFDRYGLGFSYAYNKSKDNVASNGFGGGPFFTSCDDSTIDGMGADIKADRYGVNLDLSNYGVSGLNISYSYLKIENPANQETKEDDYTLEYAIDDSLSFSIHHIVVDDQINTTKYKNTRAFVNYTF